MRNGRKRDKLLYVLARSCFLRTQAPSFGRKSVTMVMASHILARRSIVIIKSCVLTVVLGLSAANSFLTRLIVGACINFQC